MSLKWKLIIGVVIVCILVGGGYYVWSRGASARELNKKLEEAKATVGRLMGEKDSLETAWQNKEKGYEEKIRSLNGSLKRKQGEINVLENRIKELWVQRESIIIPDSPDDIVSEFRKLGYKSCSRAKKSKR